MNMKLWLSLWYFSVGVDPAQICKSQCFTSCSPYFTSISPHFTSISPHFIRVHLIFTSPHPISPHFHLIFTSFHQIVTLFHPRFTYIHLVFTCFHMFALEAIRIQIWCVTAKPRKGEFFILKQDQLCNACLFWSPVLFMSFSFISWMLQPGTTSPLLHLGTI